MTDTTTTSRLNAALEGRYRIERELGQGGMATVYLADDLKHDRKVALKVLKPELAAVVGGERFIAEIRTTANLQHPHILPLFDSGEADGFLFYVMPYVEGETLADRLGRERQLGVEEALGLAGKIADALDYAHEQGVVHRDIKPGNILLSQRGDPLVADFGIALAVSQAGGGRITETGLSMGTPHYMSPEQATGDRDVDPRSDVYALGCVLYEMLVGQPPFAAATAQGVLARILTETARDARELRHTVPPNVAAALARALEKTPADRFPTTAEFKAKLADESYRYESTEAAHRQPRAGGSEPIVVARPRYIPALLGVATLAVLLAAWGWLRPTDGSPVQAPATRLSLDLGDLQLSSGTDRVEVSPDGGTFAAVAVAPGGVRALYVRRAGEARFRLLDGTAGAFDPAFSPSGDELVFETTAGTLARISIGGGEPRTVVPAGYQPNTPLWAEDGYIYFGGSGGRLFRVADAGGEPQLVVERPGLRLYPEDLLPGGQLIATDRTFSSTLIIEGDSVRTLLDDRVDARYLASGHLLFADVTGGLWAVPFDGERGEARADPTLLFDDVGVRSGYYATYSLSRNGTLVYEPVGVRAASDEQLLMTGPIEGPLAPLNLESRNFEDTRWSPDGRFVAYASSGGGAERQVYVWDVEFGGTPIQVTTQGDNTRPVWSPDGSALAFASRRGTADDDIYVKELEGTEPPRLLVGGPGDQGPSDWPRRDLLVFDQTCSDGCGRDIWAADLSAEGSAPTLYLGSEFITYGAHLSPTGGLIAYTSHELESTALTSEGGGVEVVVRSFPTPGPLIRISEGGGRFPRWSSDGTALYYMAPSESGRSELRRADLQLVPVPAVRQTTVLLEIPDGWSFGSWDLDDDRERIVLPLPDAASGGADPASTREIVVVTNWFEEFERIMEGR
jgi:Tol biopolymer transport system component/tRNA A-37 threonylcarbamoyl transferase component Bud32